MVKLATNISRFAAPPRRSQRNQSCPCLFKFLCSSFQTRIAKGHRRISEEGRKEEHRVALQESGKTFVRGRELEPNGLAFNASRVFKPIQTFRRVDKPLLSGIYDHVELHHPRFVGVFL